MKLLIINDFGIKGGGTENRIKTLIDYFIKNNIFEEVHILQKQKDNFSSDKRIKLHICPNGYFNSYLFTKKLIQENRIDFVQAHNMMALTPAPVIAAKRLKKPVVWYAHDYWAICGFRNFINPFIAMKEELCGKAKFGKCRKCMRNLKTRLRLRLYMHMLNRADIAIANSSIMVRLHEEDGIINGRWKIVTPWINPSFFKKMHNEHARNKTKKEKIILFIGSLIDYKGAWVAAKALKHVLEEMPRVRLVFIGSEQEPDSIYRKRIESIAKNDGTLDNIKFLGKKNSEEIKKEIQNSDVYVCPTVCMESFGLNWGEAMAVGCPVIASRIGSIPEYINGNNGVLFEPRGYKELARKIITVLMDKNLSGRLSRDGMNYAKENFDINKSGKEIIKIYHHLNL